SDAPRLRVTCCFPASYSRPAPPHRSTLFPYTTLFRSERVLEVGLLRLDVLGQILLQQRILACLHLVTAQPIQATGSNEGDSHPEDRKSTRLNSSHRTISYAVFCLKKKKNHRPHAARLR